MKPSQTQLIASWKSEEQIPFSGWDFSYLTGRMMEDKTPWSYLDRARELLKAIPAGGAALDMGTGGGERLLRLRPDWPAHMLATEEYPPNVILAGRRLRQAGGEVIVAALARNVAMPFRSGVFDVLLNRHSGFNAGDVARVIKPGGTFLTRQVHGLWAEDLLAVFGARPQWPDATPETYVPWLREAGLEICRLENWQGKLAFTDVGALVYYLKAVPWLVPGFSVATHLENLLALQAKLDRGEELVYAARVYLIEARK